MIALEHSRSDVPFGFAWLASKKGMFNKRESPIVAQIVQGNRAAGHLGPKGSSERDEATIHRDLPLLIMSRNVFAHLLVVWLWSVAHSSRRGHANEE